MSSVPSFQWYDYTIFVSMLTISASIGIYLGFYASKQTTVNEYIMGKNKMKALPVALSLTASHFSGVALTGVPADIYKYGAYGLLISLSGALMALITVTVYVPVFFNLQIISIYEYLEKRFDRRSKLLASFLFILTEIIFLGFAMYPPSLALSAATGININVISLSTFFVCLYYTAIGGLRTVIWTDLFQLGVIALCSIIVGIVGFRTEGGIVTVWNKGIEGGRLDIFDFDLDPTKHDSFWFYLAYAVHLIPSVGLSQTGMQKFLTLKTFRDCVWTAVIFVITYSLVYVFCFCVGLLMYARYADCDPFLSNKISKHDQMVAYYVLDVTRNIPGMAGLFFATLCCASLSSVSCSLNALGCVIYKDFLSRFLSENISEKKGTNILKLIVATCGLVSIAILLLMQYVKEIFQISVSILGVIMGPLLGLFTMGVLLPQVNANGAFFGTVIGFITLSGIVIPKNFYVMQKAFNYPSKQLSIFGCENNLTLMNYNISKTMNVQSSTVPYIFRISHFYNCLIGTVITVVLGLVISKLTSNPTRKVEKKLISPIVRHFISEETKNDEKVLENLVTDKE